MAEKQLNKLERAALTVRKITSDLASADNTLAQLTEITARSILAADELKALGQERASAVYEVVGSGYQEIIKKYLEARKAHDFKL